jgi:hypothetical protein
MATATPKTVRVKLTYDFTHDTLTTTPEKPVLKPGTHVEFYSDQGDVDVILSPKSAFKPSEYKQGDPSVQVLKPFKNGMIWCGGRFTHVGPNVPGSNRKDIDPKQKQWGSQTVDH